MMNLNEEILEPHGGFAKNYLNNLLHLEDETFDDEEECQLRFKLSPYHDEESINTYCEANKDSINIMSLNAQSIFSKIDKLKILIEEMKIKHKSVIHIVSIQEGHITAEKSKSQIEIDDYELFIEPSKIGKKGGIAVYVHNSLKGNPVKFFEESPSKLWEGLSIDVTGSTLAKPIRIHTVYRPPREKQEPENHEIFMFEFEPYLKKIKADSTDCLIVGDINYNLLECSSNRMCQEYFDAMISHEFIPEITLPTKLNRNSCKLYDHIFTRFKTEKLKTMSCVYLKDVSDHLPVILSIKNNNIHTELPKFRYTRDTSKENVAKYLKLIEEQIALTQYETSLTSNPNINYDKLNKTLTSIYNDTFPVKKIRVTKYNTKRSPWITQGLLNSIKTGDILYRKLRKTKPDSPSYTTKENALKSHRLILNKLLRKTKKDYYTTKFDNFANDCKNTWKLLNQVAGRKTKKSELPSYFKKVIQLKDKSKIEIKIRDDKTIADQFNIYFANIGKDLSNEIKYNGKKTIESYLLQDTTSRFSFKLATDEDVLETIGTVEPKTSSGNDNISSKLLIQIAPIIH